MTATAAATGATELADEVARLRRLNASLVEETRQLREALDTRVVIEQAKGILAARLDVEVDEAFHVLRTAARSQRLKLRVLAASVVTSKELPPVLAEARVQRV